uniref:Oligopeptide transporter 1 n=1 Tax=Timema bartmani TaxID=61472 RepID=A0A7R9HWA8_9NEOP|nr:unnamed protein product [Timema bartmani]
MMHWGSINETPSSGEEISFFEPNEASTLLPDKASDGVLDSEGHEVKLKYPRSVFFIISNEFCERFSYYGMRTILVIYLRNILLYNDNDATVLYHTFTMFCYFFPLLGAMLADSLLGKFRTILYLSVVYAIGNVVISVASATGAIDIPGRELTILGLLLIALGTGGIKPCVSAFGGDQFVMPQQERQLQTFFSLFYFSINSGSLISTFLTPILRQDVKCFDQDSCYPLAFGVPAILMVVSIVVFIIGKNSYIIKKPQGNVVLEVSKCIGHAVAQKWRSKGVSRDHWLEHADDTYPRRLIEDIKSTLGVLFLFLPLPIFWALFDQQGSRWTFQATRMNGVIGSWILKPDQMQVINPLLILAFIPIFETGIYPLFAKCNLLIRPLQRMGVGGILAAVAFILSAIVELQLEPTYAVLPGSGQAQLRIFNAYNCPMNLELNSEPSRIVNGLSKLDLLDLRVSGAALYNGSIAPSQDCVGVNTPGSLFDFQVVEGQAKSVFIAPEGNEPALINIPGYDTIEKSDDGYPVIRVFYNVLTGNELKFNQDGGTKNFNYDLSPESYHTQYTSAEPASFTVMLGNKSLGQVNLQLGGVYTYILNEETASTTTALITVTSPNTMHMLWLIPQYVIMTMGEVMFSITGLEFAFTQAPVSMKSVLQSGWLLTVAFGNLVVIIIAEAKFFDSQANEFFLFAGLMLLDMALFCWMAMKYKYIETPDEDNAGANLPLEAPKSKSRNGSTSRPLNSEDKGRNGVENKSFDRDE